MAGQRHRVRHAAGRRRSGPDPGERDRARGRARAGGPDRGAASGCRTAKVKVAERGQAEAEDIARVEAVREALGPDGQDPGGRQRRLGARAGGADAAAAGARSGSSTPSSPVPPWTSWPNYVDMSISRSPPTSRSAGPRTRAGAGRGRGRHRDAEGPAARRSPRRARGGGGLRPARRGVERDRHLGRARRRGRAGRRAPRAPLRLRPGHDVLAGRGRHGQVAGPRGGGAAGPPPGRRRRSARPLGGRPGSLAGAGRGGGPYLPDMPPAAGA